MFVNIIIPSYNSEKFLISSLKSCFGQDYEKFNITLIDDHSNDNTYKLVKNYSNINYIRNEKNLGPGASRNIGINNTDGDIISFIDADDIMCKEKLTLSVDRFKGNKNIGLTCGNYKILLNRVMLMPPFYNKNIDIDHKMLLSNNYIASGSVSISREAINDVGLFNEKYWIAEDYDLWLRISEKYKIDYIMIYLQQN